MASFTKRISGQCHPAVLYNLSIDVLAASDMRRTSVIQDPRQIREQITN